MIILKGKNFQYIVVISIILLSNTVSFIDGVKGDDSQMLNDAFYLGEFEEFTFTVLLEFTIDKPFLMSKNNNIIVNCDIRLPNSNFLWIQLYEFTFYTAIDTSVGAVYHLKNNPLTNISCYGDNQVQFSHNFTTTSILSAYGPGDLYFRIGILIYFETSIEAPSSTELGDSNWIGPVNYIDNIDDPSNRNILIDEGILAIVIIFIISSVTLFLVIYRSQKKQYNERKRKPTRMKKKKKRGRLESNR